MRLAITGYGVASPFGFGRSAWESALAKGEGARELAFRGPSENLEGELGQSAKTAEVWGFDPNEHLGDKGHRAFDRLGHQPRIRELPQRGVGGELARQHGRDQHFLDLRLQGDRLLSVEMEQAVAHEVTDFRAGLRHADARGLQVRANLVLSLAPISVQIHHQ